MRATLYLDDSGQFKSSALGMTGLRVVGGLVLQGTREDHDASFGPALASALSWFPPPVHAVDIASVQNVAFQLRRSPPDRLPLRLRHLRAKLRNLRASDMGTLRFDDRDLFEAVSKESQKLLLSLRTVVGHALSESTGALVLCAEHDLALASSRFDSMLVGAIEGGLTFCASRAREEVRMKVIFESGSSGHDGDNLPGDLDVEVSSSIARLDGTPQAVPKTAGVVGLALADLVVHALGPGGRQSVPWRSAWCARWDMESLRRSSGENFGGRPPLVVVDGLRSADLLRAVRKGSINRAHAIEQLRDHERRLPRGVLRASLQWASTHLSEEER